MWKVGTESLLCAALGNVGEKGDPGLALQRLTVLLETQT